MGIQVGCACGKQLRVKDNLAGTDLNCPACGKAVTVPRAPVNRLKTRLQTTTRDKQSPTAKPSRAPKEPAVDLPTPEGDSSVQGRWLAVLGLLIVTAAGSVYLAPRFWHRGERAPSPAEEAIGGAEFQPLV